MTARENEEQNFCREIQRQGLTICLGCAGATGTKLHLTARGNNFKQVLFAQYEAPYC